MLNALYLDDEASLCELFGMIFSSESVNVVSFTDPEAAIAYSNSHPVDVIFLDYRMPGLNGDQAAKRMPAEIPKYLLTGDHATAFDYDFKNVFQKPGFIEGVTDVLQSLLSGPRSKYSAPT
jgi:CheY-like chemotaxis protein